MIKRPFTKLQVLMPGETAAPNTPDRQDWNSGCTIIVGVPFNVTINACDSVWRVVSTTTRLPFPARTRLPRMGLDSAADECDARGWMATTP